MPTLKTMICFCCQLDVKSKTYISNRYIFYTDICILLHIWIIKCTLGVAKGQLISKCPFGFIVWTKNQRNYFWIFVLSFFVASWGLHRSFLGLPVGFLVYDITYLLSYQEAPRKLQKNSRQKSRNNFVGFLSKQ